ncbi:hypothetical protein MUK42_04236 [Musa troglodytarum]|uniref:Uncharacterized protein n=1 Tax=Musa troglodytarum TaxID=320322 RepID=A0A9E7GC08_9LILI|nr:hypothetical protein MUK42_04236 [Musa troglodytarum]
MYLPHTRVPPLPTNISAEISRAIRRCHLRDLFPQKRRRRRGQRGKTRSASLLPRPLLWFFRSSTGSRIERSVGKARRSVRELGHRCVRARAGRRRIDSCVLIRSAISIFALHFFDLNADAHVLWNISGENCSRAPNWHSGLAHPGDPSATAETERAQQLS